MSKEDLAFWGPVAAAIIGAVTSVVVKLIEIFQIPPVSEAGPHSNHPLDDGNG